MPLHYHLLLSVTIYPSSFRYARRGTMSVTDKRATLERPSLPRPSAGLGIAAAHGTA